MRTKTKREIRIEVAENTIPLEEALGNIAQAIAHEMYREEMREKKGVKDK